MKFTLVQTLIIISPFLLFIGLIGYVAAAEAADTMRRRLGRPRWHGFC